MSVSRTRKRNAKKILNAKNAKIILAAFLCLAIVLISFLGYTVKQLTYNRVYDGVYINNVDISGLTRDELIAEIPEIFDGQLSKTITLKIGNNEHVFESLSLVPVIDTETMADTAFSYGRSRRFLGRLSEISGLKKNNVSVPFTLSFNNDEVQKLINTTTYGLEITAVPNTIEFGEDKLIITKGKAGKGVLFEEVRDSIEKCILSDSTVATAEYKHIDPEEITYEYVKRHIADKPVEASYSIENNRIKFVESKPGVSLDKGALEKALRNAKGDVIEVPAKIRQPQVTSESLRSQVLADELGTFSTDYSSSSNDRAYNIKLACEKINGYVLSPGEEFSYNEVVGPRTVERGFRIANVYVGNTVQPGIGGGICQVSSTMYNAVVFADLEITARKNHTLPVSYVPMGRDATVAYDSVDFKFKNTTSMPIEIRAIAEDGINTITILGTDEHPNREIKIETARTSTVSPKVVVKNDPTLLEGKVKVESAGSNGSTYISYKVVYENGVEVSRTKLANSVYAGKDRVEIHGTKKPEPEPVPEPEPEQETQDVPESSETTTTTEAPESSDESTHETTAE